MKQRGHSGLDGRSLRACRRCSQGRNIGVALPLNSGHLQFVWCRGSIQGPEQVSAGSTIHHSLQGLQAVDLAFGLAIAPRHFDRIPDCIKVPIQGTAEPALRASTFLACSKASFPLGLMHRAAAMTGEIARPVFGSRTGSGVDVILSPWGTCLSALRHPASSRCSCGKLPS